VGLEQAGARDLYSIDSTSGSFLVKVQKFQGEHLVPPKFKRSPKRGAVAGNVSSKTRLGPRLGLLGCAYKALYVSPRVSFLLAVPAVLSGLLWSRSRHFP
jgi:hypothetical protein